MKTNKKYLQLREIFASGGAVQPDKSVIDYQNSFLTIGNNNRRTREWFVYPEARSVIKEYERLFVALVEALRRLAWWIVDIKSEYLDDFGLNYLDRDTLLSRSREENFCYARIDGVMTPKGLRILEVNARRPQMFEDADWFCRRISQEYPNLQITAEENTRRIAYALLGQGALERGAFPKTVVVLCGDKKKADSPFSLLAILDLLLENLVVVETDDIARFFANMIALDNKLVYSGNNIDLIIDQVLSKRGNCFWDKGGICIPKVRTSYQQGGVKVASSALSHIIGSKLALALLCREDIQEQVGFSETELEAIGLVPKTKQVNEWKQNDTNTEWVLKSYKKSSGKGVFDLSKLSKEELVETIGKSENQSVLQEKLSFANTKVFPLGQKGREVSAKLTLEPFVVRGPEDKLEVSGYSCRGIDVSRYTDGLKFNPAGGKEEIMFGGLIEYAD